MPVKVAINGFGRIGRLVARALLGMPEPVDLVAVNDMADPDHLAHLFRYDSVHGRYPGQVEVVDGGLSLDGDHLRVLSEPDPARLPWRELEPDWVVESTGRFSDRSALRRHVEAGAQRVMLSAPGKDVDVTLVRGVNEDRFVPDHRLVSNASCTTNSLAVVLKVLHEAFGVRHAFMTSVHAYTSDQRLLDAQHKDLRRARAAAQSIIPTSTGAARAIGDVLPALAGKVDGLAVRVPVPNVSLIDLTARLGRHVGVEDMAEAFGAAARGQLAGILNTEERPLVSVDYNHDPHSATVDLPSLMVLDDGLVKVLAWYDNEWGFSHRMADAAAAMGRAG